MFLYMYVSIQVSISNLLFQNLKDKEGDTDEIRVCGKRNLYLSYTVSDKTSLKSRRT